MVYLLKATDGARLAEMLRLPKMFKKLGLIFLEVTRHFLPKWSDFRRYSVKATFSVFT